MSSWHIYQLVIGNPYEVTNVLEEEAVATEAGDWQSGPPAHAIYF